jgi:hypothetical protein
MSHSANKIADFFLKPISLGCLIFLASFFIRWIALNQTAFGNGWDSYFYAVQIKSILTEGKMKSPEWVLFYPLLLAVNLFFSDPIVSVKIMGCLLAGSFSALVYFFALKFYKKEVALFFGAITLFSPELTYFTAQWPKNLLGVDLLLALLLAIANDKKILVIALVIMGLFGHRMTAVLGIGCTIFWFSSKYFSLRVLLGALIVLVAIVSITLIFPGVINLKDYQRVQNLISTRPQLAPVSFISTFGSHRISSLWLMELVVTGLAGIILLVKELSTVQKKKSNIGLMISLLMLTLWFPFFFWDVSGAAYRLFHVGVLMLPLILIFLLVRIVEWNTTIFTVLTFILCGLGLFGWKSYDPQKQDPPYALYQRIAEKTMGVIKGHEPELIIAHKSLAEFFTYQSGLDAMPWIPDYVINENKLWRIAVLPYPKMFYYYTNQSPIKLKANYYYLQENEWQKFLKNIRQNESADLVNDHLTWLNPSYVRPVFLKKN